MLRWICNWTSKSPASGMRFLCQLGMWNMVQFGHNWNWLLLNIFPMANREHILCFTHTSSSTWLYGKKNPTCCQLKVDHFTLTSAHSGTCLWSGLLLELLRSLTTSRFNSREARCWNWLRPEAGVEATRSADYSFWPLIKLMPCHSVLNFTYYFVF